MNTIRRKILESLGITVIFCTVAGVFIYGALLIVNDTNLVLGAWIIGIVAFIAIFAGVYLGKD